MSSCIMWKIYPICCLAMYIIFIYICMYMYVYANKHTHTHTHAHTHIIYIKVDCTVTRINELIKILSDQTCLQIWKKLSFDKLLTMKYFFNVTDLSSVTLLDFSMVFTFFRTLALVTHRISSIYTIFMKKWKKLITAIIMIAIIIMDTYPLK